MEELLREDTGSKAVMLDAPRSTGTADTASSPPGLMLTAPEGPYSVASACIKPYQWSHSSKQCAALPQRTKHFQRLRKAYVNVLHRLTVGRLAWPSRCNLP